MREVKDLQVWPTPHIGPNGRKHWVIWWSEGQEYGLEFQVWPIDAVIEVWGGVLDQVDKWANA